MKYQCPKCQTHHTCSNSYSLYNDVDCESCSCKFRLADANHKNGRIREFFLGFFFNMQKMSCPYCEEFIPVGYIRKDGSFPVPDVCGHCGRDLPGPIDCQEYHVGKENKSPVNNEEMFDPTDAFSPIWSFSEENGHEAYEAAVEKNGGKDLSWNQQVELHEKLEPPRNKSSMAKQESKYQFIPPVNPTEAQSTEIQSPMDMSKLSTKLQKGSIYDPNSASEHLGQLKKEKRWHDFINHPEFHIWSLNAAWYPQLQSKVNNWLQQGWITPAQQQAAQERITHAMNMPRNEL